MSLRTADRAPVSRAIASGLGAGYAPRAPGTFGSLLGLALGWALMLGPAWLLPAACAVVALGGTWAIRRVAAGDDPGWVVVDEVAGQFVALLGLSRPGLPGLVAAFALFRLLDIAKPGPVGWADRQGGAVSVMADDLIAGAIAALALLAVRDLWPGSGL